jgi:hypothetical protein
MSRYRMTGFNVTPGYGPFNERRHKVPHIASVTSVHNHERSAQLKSNDAVEVIF